MIRLKVVLKLHSNSIINYGGADGVRDMSLLESAINRPFATFDGKDLYPTAIEKSAALLESILINHPFVDGNKRTAFSLMLFVLDHEKIELTAGLDEIYRLVISIAEGKLGIEQIIEWLNSNTRTS